MGADEKESPVNETLVLLIFLGLGAALGILTVAIADAIEKRSKKDD